VGKESVGKENAVQDCRSSGKRGKGECAFGINQDDAENAEKEDIGKENAGKENAVQNCSGGKCGKGEYALGINQTHAVAVRSSGRR